MKKNKKIKIVQIDKDTKEVISAIIVNHNDIFDGEWQYGDVDVYTIHVNALSTEEFWESMAEKGNQEWDVEELTVPEMTEKFKNYLTKEQQDKLKL